MRGRATIGDGRRRRGDGRCRRGASSGLVLILVAAIALTADPVRAEPYQIDYARSELVVRVFKAGPASLLAHDHVVRAASWSGTLDVNRDPVALAADFRVDARALQIDEPEVRARHGLDGQLSESDRAEVRQTMLGAAQLDVESHPEIRFTAAEIDRAGNEFRLAGELTLHGKSKRISLPISVSESAGALTARGSVRVAQSDFGIAPYSAFLGAVRTQDEIELVVTVVASPSGTGKEKP